MIASAMLKAMMSSPAMTTFMSRLGAPASARPRDSKIRGVKVP
jgi:hypothetical protein